MASCDKDEGESSEKADRNEKGESNTRYLQSPTYEDVEIKPGLIALNLNVLLALDMHMIEDTKKHLMKDIERQHYVVEDILRNMIALLKTKIPREKFEARLELEDLIQQDPKNLNALADLEYIYRELNRVADADQCKKDIDAILRSTKDDDILCQQACLLEQGYAILIERTLLNENTLELRISELQKILNAEQERSEGKRQEYLEKGLHHQLQVLRNVQTAYDHDSVDPHIHRKGSSLQKFEAAEKLCKSLPHPVWNFYYGKALNQYYDSLETVLKLSDDRFGMENAKKSTTIKAIEKFWHIIKNYQDDDKEMFHARSYAYIGHILSRRRELLQIPDGLDSKFDFLRQAEFRQYLDNPLEALKQGYKMKPDDTTVLNRYGRALWNRSIKLARNDPAKIEFLVMADEMLSASIQIDSNGNWWAFSSRMQVRLHMADTKTSEAEQRQLLEKARDDGLICFKSKHTRSDMSILAEIFEKLAKCPDIQQYGPEFVRDKKLLHKALDYLFYASHLGDPVDYKWTQRIASCLFDLGEYEQAVEWQRKSWFLAAPSSYFPFTLLCLFMLTMFEKRNIWHTAPNYVLKELLYVMIYGKKKYTDLSKSISNLYFRKQGEFCKFFSEILFQRQMPLRSEEIDIIQLFLEVFIEKSNGHRYNSRFKSLGEKLKTVVPEKETEYKLSDIFNKPSFRPIEKGLKPCSTEFKYDFFVCHSQKDAALVDKVLVQNLERKFDQNDVDFKGCIADRDFVPGVPILENMVNAINNSYKIILVLTNHFTTNTWCQYEAEHVVMKYFELGNQNRNCVVPVLLENCVIPANIRHLHVFDLTTKQDFMQEIKRLKKALLPGDS